MCPGPRTSLLPSLRMRIKSRGSGGDELQVNVQSSRVQNSCPCTAVFDSLLKQTHVVPLTVVEGLVVHINI